MNTTLPQSVMAAIDAYRLAVATVGAINTLEKATPERKLQCYKDEDVTRQALISEIAALVRPVGVDESLLREYGKACIENFSKPSGETFHAWDNLHQRILAAYQPASALPDVDAVMIGGNHLANWLLGKSIFPEIYKDYDAVLEAHGHEVADVWAGWKGIMDLRTAVQAMGRTP
jgi:hypothetical protein